MSDKSYIKVEVESWKAGKPRRVKFNGWGFIKDKRTKRDRTRGNINANLKKEYV